MLYFQFFSVVQNRVIDEYVVCARPGCAAPKPLKEEEKELPAAPAKVARLRRNPRNRRRLRPVRRRLRSRPVLRSFCRPNPVISAPIPVAVEIELQDPEDPLNEREEQELTDFPTEFPTPGPSEPSEDARDGDRLADAGDDDPLSKSLSELPLAQPTNRLPGRLGERRTAQGHDCRAVRGWGTHESQSRPPIGE